MDAKDHLIKRILTTEDENKLKELTILLKQEIEYNWGKDFNWDAAKQNDKSEGDLNKVDDYLDIVKNA